MGNRINVVKEVFNEGVPKLGRVSSVRWRDCDAANDELRN